MIKYCHPKWSQFSKAPRFVILNHIQKLIDSIGTWSNNIVLFYLWSTIKSHSHLLNIITDFTNLFFSLDYNSQIVVRKTIVTRRYSATLRGRWLILSIHRFGGTRSNKTTVLFHLVIRSLLSVWRVEATIVRQWRSLEREGVCRMIMKMVGRNFYGRLDKSVWTRIMARPDRKSKSIEGKAAKLIGPYRRGDCRSAFLSRARSPSFPILRGNQNWRLLLAKMFLPPLCPATFPLYNRALDDRWLHFTSSSFSKSANMIYERNY